MLNSLQTLKPEGIARFSPLWRLTSHKASISPLSTKFPARVLAFSISKVRAFSWWTTTCSHFSNRKAGGRIPKDSCDQQEFGSFACWKCISLSSSSRWRKAFEHGYRKANGNICPLPTIIVAVLFLPIRKMVPVSVLRRKRSLYAFRALDWAEDLAFNSFISISSGNEIASNAKAFKVLKQLFNVRRILAHNGIMGGRSQRRPRFTWNGLSIKQRAVSFQIPNFPSSTPPRGKLTLIFTSHVIVGRLPIIFKRILVLSLTQRAQIRNGQRQFDHEVANAFSRIRIP